MRSTSTALPGAASIAVAPSLMKSATTPLSRRFTSSMNFGGNDHSRPTISPTFFVIVRPPPRRCSARVQVQIGADSVRHVQRGLQVRMPDHEKAVGHERQNPVAPWRADGQQLHRRDVRAEAGLQALEPLDVADVARALGGLAAISPNMVSPLAVRYHSMCVKPVLSPSALSTARPMSRPPAR